MSHAHLPPTYALVRPRPELLDAEILARALAKIGPEPFPGAGAVVLAGLVAS